MARSSPNRTVFGRSSPQGELEDDRDELAPRLLPILHELDDRAARVRLPWRLRRAELAHDDKGGRVARMGHLIEIIARKTQRLAIGRREHAHANPPIALLADERERLRRR